jgi:rhodanese-related sulfurtransferase
MRLNCGACLLAGLIAFGIACAQPSSSASKTISAEQLAKLLETPGKVYFLDVREPEEIARLGSVKNYVNIPMSQLSARLKEVPKDKLIVTL